MTDEKGQAVQSFKPEVVRKVLTDETAKKSSMRTNHVQDASSQTPIPNRNAATRPDLDTIRFLYDTTASNPMTIVAIATLIGSSRDTSVSSDVMLHLACHVRIIKLA